MKKMFVGRVKWTTPDRQRIADCLVSMTEDSVALISPCIDTLYKLAKNTSNYWLTQIYVNVDD